MVVLGGVAVSQARGTPVYDSGFSVEHEIQGLGYMIEGVGFKPKVWDLGSDSEAGSYLRLIDFCITQL